MTLLTDATGGHRTWQQAYLCGFAWQRIDLDVGRHAKAKLVEGCGEGFTKQFLVGWQRSKVWMAELPARWANSSNGSHVWHLPELYWAVIGAGVKRQIVNQVEGHSEICTKTRLADNLRRYANEQKLDCCWVPETFVVSAGYNEGSLHVADNIQLSLSAFLSSLIHTPGLIANMRWPNMLTWPVQVHEIQSCLKEKAVHTCHLLGCEASCMTDSCMQCHRWQA